jgi:hypothetical protein
MESSSDSVQEMRSRADSSSPHSDLRKSKVRAMTGFVKCCHSGVVPSVEGYEREYFTRPYVEVVVVVRNILGEAEKSLALRVSGVIRAKRRGAS